MSLTRPQLPCVFEVQEPEAPLGTLVYFHPGGLSAEVIKQLAQTFDQWRILQVELMMCTNYIEATDKKGQLQSTIEEIGLQICEQLQFNETPQLQFWGWSFGGNIAYEIATKWQGKVEPQLVMFDSIAPIKDQAFSAANTPSGLMFKWFVQYVQALKNCRLTLATNWFKRQSADEILTDLLQQAKSQNAFDTQTKLPGFRKVFTTFAKGLMRNSKLGAAYRPAPYHGQVLLFRASKGLLKRFYFVRHMGWKSLVKQLNIQSVECDHYQMISDEKIVAQLGEQIRTFNAKSVYVGK